MFMAVRRRNPWPMPERDKPLAELLRSATQALGDRYEAELLLGHALGRDRAWLMAHGRDVPDAAQSEAFAALVQRRLAGEPVAYITGVRGFWTMDLEVNPAVLIPRPETELLVEQALAHLPPEGPCRVADLGTGSGAVALAIAGERPQADVVATDVSREALAVARANAVRLGRDNVRFAAGAWWQPLAGQKFDVVASNPPYVAAGDKHLDEGDLPFEPGQALVGGPDGLADIRAIVAAAGQHLLPGGWLLLEHGFDQGEAVRDLLQRHGFVAVSTARDLAGIERVSCGQWPEATQGGRA